jgi:putative oxidoreductase
MSASPWRTIVATRAPVSVILIRLMVGLVFLSEGLQKFLDPGNLGPGRFEKIGFAASDALAYFVACFEVTGGALLVLGLFTRLAAIPLIIIMLTALTTTKLPILIGHDLWGFHVRTLPEYGFRAMAHAARTDWAMLLGSIFLLIVGGGRWSLDARIWKRQSHAAEADRPPHGRPSTRLAGRSRNTFSSWRRTAPSRTKRTANNWRRCCASSFACTRRTRPVRTPYCSRRCGGSLRPTNTMPLARTSKGRNTNSSAKAVSRELSTRSPPSRRDWESTTSPSSRRSRDCHAAGRLALSPAHDPQEG